MKDKAPVDLSKATARPWATDIDVETFDGAQMEIATIFVNHGSGQGGEICAFRHDPDDGLDNNSEEQRANAHLIVLAVNQYDALVAVAEAAENVTKRGVAFQDLTALWNALRKLATAREAKKGIKL